jgi:lysophospholipase L1-like esterase
MSIAALFAAIASAQAPPRTVADMACPPMPVVSAARTALVVDDRPHIAPMPPAGAADRAAFLRWSAIDPDGLCRYRDANRALPPAGPGRVVFIGDSITETWALAIPALFAGDTLDRGVSGQTTTQMLARFRLDVLDLHPAVVHIMGGINDIARAPGTALTRSNIQSMVELARAHGIAVILGSVTSSSRFQGSPDLKPGPHIAWLNRWLRDYATRNDLIFVDYHAALVDAELGIRDGLSNDGLHPNRSGFTIMTPLAQAAIRRALAGRHPR